MFARAENSTVYNSHWCKKHFQDVCQSLFFTWNHRSITYCVKYHTTIFAKYPRWMHFMFVLSSFFFLSAINSEHVCWRLLAPFHLGGAWSQSMREGVYLFLNKKYCSVRCCITSTIQRVNRVKVEWRFLLIFCSLLLVSFWAGRLKRSDNFCVMLVISVKENW